MNNAEKGKRPGSCQGMKRQVGAKPRAREGAFGRSTRQGSRPGHGARESRVQWGRAGACRVLPMGITGRYLGEYTEVSGNARGVERRPAGGSRVSVKASRTVSTGGVEKRAFGHRALLLPTSGTQYAFGSSTINPSTRAAILSSPSAETRVSAGSASGSPRTWTSTAVASCTAS